MTTADDVVQTGGTVAAWGKINFAPSARERYFLGSGQPMPAPTDEEIAATIRRQLGWAIGNDTLNTPDAQRAMMAAAQAVRQLFPINQGDKT